MLPSLPLQKHCVLRNHDQAIFRTVLSAYQALRANFPTPSYTAVGQLLSEDGPWTSDTVSYTYQNRLRTSLSVQAPNASAWSQTYAYDAAKRLTNVTSPAGAFGYQYPGSRPSALVSRLALPNGAYITNTYDSVARLLSTTLKNTQNSTLNTHNYSYNQGNQRTQQVFTAGNYVDYTYDNISQLKTAKGKESGGTERLHEKLGYAYDAAGNLNQRTNNALIQTFNVNSLNELTTISRSGTLTVAGTTTSPATNVTVNSLAATLYTDATFAKDGFSLTDGTNTFVAVASDVLSRRDTNTVTVNLPTTNSFTYDLNGNLISDGKRGFDYDDENQLIRLTVTNGWKSEFTYDSRMRRRIRKEFTWNGSWVQTDEVCYVYDGNLVIQERDANNLPLVSYTRGNDLSGSLQGAGGIGGLLARTDNSQLNTQNSTLASAYYHFDGNGNVTALINSNHILVAKYLYDPYGNILSQSGPLAEANLYQFSSKEYHANSGLIYFGGRFYSPSMQRWLSRDPLGELSGINLYRYVRNNPVNEDDPFGLTNQPGDFGWGWYTSPLPAGYGYSVALVSYQPIDFANLPPLSLSQSSVNTPAAVLTQGDPNAIPYTPRRPRDPTTYDALLVGAPHLVGTPPGEQLAGMNANLINSALIPAAGSFSWLSRCPGGVYGLRYAQRALKAGDEIAYVYDAETAELAFARYHEAARALLGMPTMSENIVYGTYKAGQFVPYTGSAAAQQGAERAVISALEPY